MTMMMVVVACHFRDDYKLWSVPPNPFACVCPSAGAHNFLKLMWPSNAENTLEFKFQSSLLAVAPCFPSVLSGLYPFSSKISRATLPSVSLTIVTGPGMLVVAQPLL